MTRILTVLTLLTGFTHLINAQTVEVDRSIRNIYRIDTITDKMVVYYDEFEPDTIVFNQCIYDENSLLIEKRYNFISEGNFYTSAHYFYNRDRTLIRTEIRNPDLPSQIGHYMTNPETDCTYYDRNGFLDKSVKKFRSGFTETRKYFYEKGVGVDKSKFVKGAGSQRSYTSLPVRVEVRNDEVLKQTILIEYHFRERQ